MSMICRSIGITSLVLALLAALPAKALTISYLPSEEPKEKYQVELVQFLLSKLDKEHRMVPIDTKEMVISRKISEIQRGNLSFAAIATSQELEQTLRPVRIPVLKGLLGHRVFIIRGGEQSRFAGISNLEQLKSFMSGQGKFWGSTPILQNAGLPMVTPTKYESLFYMLEGGRFDYFPRAVHEPFSEIAKRPDLGLEVEPNLMLVYPLPMYLFTSRENEALARELERAFEIAIEDGSFNEWFYSHPLIKDALSKVNIAKRTILKIDNPNLPASAPLDRKELWLNTAAIGESLNQDRAEDSMHLVAR